MKIKYQIISALLLSVLLFSILPISAGAEEYRGEAYEQLTSDDQRNAYGIVEEGIASLTETITFPEHISIYRRDLIDIIHAVCLDHPEYFWFLENGYYEYTEDFGGELVSSFTPEYVLDGNPVSAGSQKLVDAMITFQTKVNDIVKGIPVNYTSDYSIALYLHDYLVDHITYSLSGNHDSAYSALIHSEAACYGYSKAYQCLLNASGVRARTITGQTPTSDGTYAGHAWNLVWVDGICYYVDVTWDDMEDAALHGYFGLTLKEFSLEHIPDSEFILPDCSHSSINYYSTGAGSGVAKVFKKTSGVDAAAYFKHVTLQDSTCTLACEIQFEGAGFHSWIFENRQSIMGALGVSEDADMEYIFLGDVYYVTVSDTHCLHQSSVDSIILNLESVELSGAGRQAQLEIGTQGHQTLTAYVFESSDPTVVQVSDSGLITAVNIGTASITVSTLDGRKSAYCQVNVTEAPEHIHSLRQIAPVEANCATDGNLTFFICTGCGMRYADERAIQMLSDVTEYVLPATNHVDLKWKSFPDNHVQQCACGFRIEDTFDSHVDADGDLNCDVCRRMLVQNPSEKTDRTSADRGYPVWILIILLAVVFAVIIIRKRRYG